MVTEIVLLVPPLLVPDDVMVEAESEIGLKVDVGKEAELEVDIAVGSGDSLFAVRLGAQDDEREREPLMSTSPIEEDVEGVLDSGGDVGCDGDDGLATAIVAGEDRERRAGEDE